MAPRQMKELYAPGTMVWFRARRYGQHRHNGHECRVLESWVKVAGATPRNFYKYRLLCTTCDKPFSTEDGGMGGKLTPSRNTVASYRPRIAATKFKIFPVADVVDLIDEGRTAMVIDVLENEAEHADDQRAALAFSLLADELDQQLTD